MVKGRLHHGLQLLSAAQQRPDDGRAVLQLERQPAQGAVGGHFGGASASGGSHQWVASACMLHTLQTAIVLWDAAATGGPIPS